MLVKRPLGREGIIALVAFQVVSWRVEMLVERPLGREGLIALVAFKIVSWRN
jgi:hypothetical protein